MRTSAIALALSGLVLAACAQESRTTPVSTAPAGGGPSSQMPQPANALPPGTAVNAPLDTSQGTISTTRTGPARP